MQLALYSPMSLPVHQLNGRQNQFGVPTLRCIGVNVAYSLVLAKDSDTVSTVLSWLLSC